MCKPVCLAGIRLNKQPPAITFRKKDKGGISLTTTINDPKLDLDSAPCCCLHLRAGRLCLVAPLWDGHRYLAISLPASHECRCAHCRGGSLVSCLHSSRLC